MSQRYLSKINPWFSGFILISTGVALWPITLGYLSARQQFQTSRLPSDKRVEINYLVALISVSIVCAFFGYVFFVHFTFKEAPAMSEEEWLKTLKTYE